MIVVERRKEEEGRLTECKFTARQSQAFALRTTATARKDRLGSWFSLS